MMVLSAGGREIAWFMSADRPAAHIDARRPDTRRDAVPGDADHPTPDTKPLDGSSDAE